MTIILYLCFVCGAYVCSEEHARKGQRRFQDSFLLPQWFRKSNSRHQTCTERYHLAGLRNFLEELNPRFYLLDVQRKSAIFPQRSLFVL